MSTPAEILQSLRTRAGKGEELPAQPEVASNTPKKTLAELAAMFVRKQPDMNDPEAIIADLKEQILDLEEALDTTDVLGVILKRALRSTLLTLQPYGAANVEVDIDDLGLPDAPPTATFFLDENDELDMA